MLRTLSLPPVTVPDGLKQQIKDAKFIELYVTAEDDLAIGDFVKVESSPEPEPSDALTASSTASGVESCFSAMRTWVDTKPEESTADGRIFVLKGVTENERLLVPWIPQNLGAKKKVLYSHFASHIRNLMPEISWKMYHATEAPELSYEQFSAAIRGMADEEERVSAMSKEECARHAVGLEEEAERKRRIADNMAILGMVPGVGGAKPVPGMGKGGKGLGLRTMSTPTPASSATVRQHVGSRPVGLAGLMGVGTSQLPENVRTAIENLSETQFVLVSLDTNKTDLEIKENHGPLASENIGDVWFKVCSELTDGGFMFWQKSPNAAPIALLWSPDSASAKGKMKLSGLKSSVRVFMGGVVVKEARDGDDLKEILGGEGCMARVHTH